MAACSATWSDPLADLVPWHAQVLRAEGQLRLDRGADDLLGRVLQDGPDGQRDVAQLQLGGRPTGEPDRLRRARPDRRAGSAR